MNPSYLRKHPAVIAAFAASTFLLGCSTPAPRPDQAQGEISQANVSFDNLQELIEITRRGLPRRFQAERASDVRQTLLSWSKAAGMTLNWKSRQSLQITGAIDEMDIRAAVMAMAAQFPHDQAALSVSFPTPKVMLVEDVLSQDASQGKCPAIASGAIVLGRYCLLAQQKWAVHPEDKVLSATLKRWAADAGLELRWSAQHDWPILLKAPKTYSGDLLSAIDRATQDLQASGVVMRFAITNGLLTILAQPTPKPTSGPAPSPSVQFQEKTK